MAGFKKYQVTVTDAKTKVQLAQFEKIAKSKSDLAVRYNSKLDPHLRYVIKRLFKKPGVQSGLWVE